LHDLIQTVTYIRALKVMNRCQIITIYLSGNKHYGQKTVVTVEPGTGSMHASIKNYKQQGRVDV
jgi:hypothetical protein